MRNYWAKVLFCEFIRHYRKLDDKAIAADIRQSMDDLEAQLPNGNSFGAKMVRRSNERIEFNRETRGRKGGRPRKNQDALASQPKSLPGTSSGNGEALNDEGATAPAGQSFEARQAAPEAQLERASGQPSTPVPVSAHGDAAEGGLLTPWYGPGTGETFDQETARADARIREDRDASATVRAQHFDGDAATREGAVDNLTPQGEASESATSPSDIQKRPDKSADASGSPNHGGSERGGGRHCHRCRPPFPRGEESGNLPDRHHGECPGNAGRTRTLPG